ncbi:hypothetical protein [Klenkia sp. PcliD-1-E]|uniref:hypothetical protein n=1 Tax=Klenkia sp. PcliD-1-E TaxID=2954492 RepID=UPI002096A5CD|nr:hypothetical protein [Klenkia sp. PcliD-1-E]MCO7220696.1 hypothetical protein [Klenkia sp. PcliD-1-E]
MRAAEAVAAAADAVLDRWSGDPALRGAFLAGSVTDLEPDDEVPATSDIDVTVVLVGTTGGRRKVRIGELVVETTLLDVAELADEERVARTHWLAPSFRGGFVLADPTGAPRRLEDRIAPGFTAPDAVLGRVDDVLQLVRHRLATAGPADSWAAAVLGWVFPISLPTQAPLVAALRTPTVRRRYAAAREVLDAGTHEWLTGLLVPHDPGPAAVRAALGDLAAAWPADGVDDADLPFAADLSAWARAVALRGGAELVDAGLHREAVFWTVVSAARCAVALGRGDGAPFADLAAGLTGVRDSADLAARRDRCLAGLPALRQACVDLISR